MSDVSTFRLYLLRATYLLIAIGLAVMISPRVIHHTSEWALENGDTAALLAGAQVLAMLGVRYPMKMPPLLLFGFIWKLIWLIAIGLPLWRAGQVDPGTAESFKACGMGVILCAVAIPWPYVVEKFLRAPGDRWK